MRADAKDRRKMNRKRRGRGISVPLIVAMIVFLIVTTSASISAFEWLRDFCLSRAYISGITVEGNRRISSENIMKAAGLRVGVDSVCSVMPHLLEKYISTQSRYLDRVSVTRRFVRGKRAGLCGWLTIEVTEREPIAFVRLKGDNDPFIVVDARGFVLEEVPAGSKPACLSPGETLPVIVGVDEKILNNKVQDNPRMKDTLSGPVFNLALNVLIAARSVAPELFSKISCIDAGDPDNVILLLQEESGVRGRGKKAKREEPGRAGHEFTDPGSKVGITIQLASDQIKDVLNSILPVIAKRKEEGKRTGYMDARFSGAVYCGERTNYERRWKSG